ncbi:ABC transporter substrate-binding protein [Flavobacterium sp.]|uniref:ABC transporter substrate-binding protein n=1 Tax=Flavobacterium sp. TaxID=239 RepID=UPI0037C044A7
MKPIQITDSLGTQHGFETTPKRIVSLVPSQTELLYDLGLEDQIVGITKFCVHPVYFRTTKTIVGGTKQVKMETIAALQPDIIICNKEENTQEMVAQLLTICPVWVTHIQTIEDNLQTINDLGQLFNKRIEAQKWIDKINFRLDDFRKFIADKPVKKVAYFIWANPHMVAGNSTYINTLLQLNRLDNIYAKKPGRYPEVELKKIRLEGDPDYVFLSSEPFPFKDEHAFEIGRYTHHAKTVFVDGEFFSWHGTRLFKALEYFKLLHLKI